MTVMRWVVACLALASLGSTQSVDAKWKESDLSGEYYFGDGLGVNCSLNISPDGQFQFKWTGCLGTYDQNMGPISIEGDELILHPALKNVREGFSGTATRFYPVKWGPRLYLVPEEQMVGFCNKIRDGWVGPHETRSLTYYCKDEGGNPANNETTLKPIVPDKFSSIIATGR